jgi:hypothetical protein
MATKRNTAEEFVRAWQQAGSATEAATALGLTYGSVRCRATQLRRRGVPLKRMGVSTKRLDIPALAALAKSLAA